MQPPAMGGLREGTTGPHCLGATEEEGERFALWPPELQEDKYSNSSHSSTIL